MGVFANHPEPLQLADHDTVDVPGFVSKLPVSGKHQILLYVTLLETNKLYLMNAFRMPAAQTLLLFSQSVDTNGDFGRLVCDGWLELRFVDPSAAQSLLLKACQLRYRWNQLLMLRLDQPQNPVIKMKEKDIQQLERKIHKMQRELYILSSFYNCNLITKFYLMWFYFHRHYDLIDFTQTQILYTIKRLLAADMKIIYRGHVEEEDDYSSADPVETKDVDINPFWPEFKAAPHPRKGGMQMADFLVYGWYFLLYNLDHLIDSEKTHFFQTVY